MSRCHGHGPPVSRISAVARFVAAVFDLAGDPTPIMVGAAYVGTKDAPAPVGGGSRVVFVPHRKGTLSGPERIGSGYVGALSCICDVHVRAPESGDDTTRFDAAEALMDRVVNCLRCVPGRIATISVEDDSPADVDAYGADLVARFSYYRGIPRDAAIFAAAAQVGAAPTLDPMRPRGSTGNTFTISVDAETSAGS